MSIAHDDWPRMLALVDQALDLPASQRLGWLRDLDLPDSLKKALLGLLTQRKAIETGNFLAGLPVLPQLGPLPDAPGRLIPGGLVGPWRLLREIGQGGMSTVWLAERADDQLTRRVALKLPHAGPGQDLLAVRLLRERNILAALEHPHIARLYDVGVTDAGTPYLVMEYVEGDSLLAYANAKRLTISQRLALFRQVLRAVHFAHGKLVLHRDLKPSNILVSQVDDVKLLDFGIAQVLTAEGALHDETELTRSTGRRMTPAYASPEQLRGIPLGTASDVYSLGVVLYELLCGQRPFAGESSAVQLEHAILHLEPRPLHRHAATVDLAPSRSTSPGRLQKMLAGDLNAIVLKALANAPERRYASAEAMDMDLARWLADKPVLARAPSRWYHLSKFVRRNKLAVGLSTAALVALVAAGSAAFVQGSIATQQAARAASVRDFLLAMFDETDLDRAESKELTAKALLENGSRRALSNLAQAPELRAELLTYIGKAQMNISDRVGAEKTLTESTSVYRALKDDRHELLVLLDRADNALSMGQSDDAQALLTQAGALARPDVADPLVAESMAQMQGTVAMFRGDDALAKSSFERYLALAATRPDTPPAELVNALDALAWVTSRHDNDLPGALALIERALQTLRQHPEVPTAMRLDVVNFRQDIAYNWGQYAELGHSLPQDIRDCDGALSRESPVCLRLRARLQGVRLSLGLLADAAALNGELAPMLDPSSPRDQLQASMALARTLAWNGQIAQRPDLVRQLKQMASAEGDNALDSSYRQMALDTLAEVDVLLGRSAEVLDWVAQADRLAASEDQSKGRTPASQRIRLFEGVALHLQGQDRRALAAMAHFCSAASRSGGMTRIQDHLYSLNCVPSLSASGQPAAAIELLQKTLPVLREGMGADAPTMLRAQRWLDELRTTGRLSPPRSPADLLFS